MTWRYVNAAARGTSHALDETPCQDDCLVALSGAAIIAITCDGAGSAQRAEEGSGLACSAFVAAAEAWLGTGGKVEAIARADIDVWIEAVRAAIAARASKQSLVVRDFACTLVAAVVTTDAAAYVQLGDGAIVIGANDAYEVVFWPDGGEYANTTFFVTDDDWAAHVHFEVRAQTIDEIALLTDGLQRLALRFDARTAHDPFFRPMFETLRAADCGYATALEPDLLAFLGSSSVNARTDDDKTLILATRRGKAPDGSV